MDGLTLTLALSASFSDEMRKREKPVENPCQNTECEGKPKACASPSPVTTARRTLGPSWKRDTIKASQSSETKAPPATAKTCESTTGEDVDAEEQMDSLRQKIQENVVESWETLGDESAQLSLAPQQAIADFSKRRHPRGVHEANTTPVDNAATAVNPENNGDVGFDPPVVLVDLARACGVPTNPTTTDATRASRALKELLFAEVARQAAHILGRAMVTTLPPIPSSPVCRAPCGKQGGAYFSRRTDELFAGGAALHTTAAHAPALARALEAAEPGARRVFAAVPYPPRLGAAHDAPASRDLWQEICRPAIVTPSNTGDVSEVLPPCVEAVRIAVRECNRDLQWKAAIAAELSRIASNQLARARRAVTEREDAASWAAQRAKQLREIRDVFMDRLLRERTRLEHAPSAAAAVTKSVGTNEAAGEGVGAAIVNQLEVKLAQIDRLLSDLEVRCLGGYWEIRLNARLPSTPTPICVNHICTR